jgi:hypothetical protein
VNVLGDVARAFVGIDPGRVVARWLAGSREVDPKRGRRSDIEMYERTIWVVADTDVFEGSAVVA